MTITLSPELETFVNEKVNSGVYPSVNEAVTDILQKFREDEILRGISPNELRSKIQESLDSYGRGEYTEYDREALAGYADKVMAETKRRWEAKQAEGVK